MRNEITKCNWYNAMLKTSKSRLKTGNFEIRWVVSSAPFEK